MWACSRVGRVTAFGKLASTYSMTTSLMFGFYLNVLWGVPVPLYMRSNTLPSLPASSNGDLLCRA